MKPQWIMETHGDPLGTVRRVIHTIWRQTKLDGLLLPVSDLQGAGVQSIVLEDAAQVNRFNPFRPLMTTNAARLLPRLLTQRPHDRLGAVLRPCELRAFNAIIAKGPDELRELAQRNLLTISIDCLGTYPASDYQWRADRKGSAESLSGDAIQFARQGGIMTYRYRSACQVCSTPEAREADLNIGVLGLPVRQHILVSARDERIAGLLELKNIVDAAPGPDTLLQRERMLSKITDRNDHTRQRVWSGLADVLPVDIQALITHFEQCGDCQMCMDVCPICASDYPQKAGDGRYAYKDILSWIVSCSGCGMCDQNCPSHQPLSTIFSYLRENLAGIHQMAS
jgi:formate dehydrogenase subunit beta